MPKQVSEAFFYILNVFDVFFSQRVFLCELILKDLFEQVFVVLSFLLAQLDFQFFKSLFEPVFVDQGFYLPKLLLLELAELFP